MSTADLNATSPEPRGLEADLVRALAFQPAGRTLDLVDRRVADALAAQERARASHRPGRRAGFIAFAAAASLFLLGASGGLQLLYGILSGPFDVPWHRGQVVGLSQVVDGYRVTIDRAYADATRLALAISIVDERERPGTSQLGLAPVLVTDADGEYTGGGGGATSVPDGRFLATNVAWTIPPVLPVASGPRMIHVEIPWIGVRDDATPPPNPDLDPETDGDEWNPWREVPGPWTFDFEIDVDGGTAIEPVGASDVLGRHKITITRVIAAPSIVRLELAVDDPDLTADGWVNGAEVHHNGEVSRVVYSILEMDGTVSLETEGGLGDVRGEWTVVIPSMSAPNGDEIPGPWTITFTVP